MSLYLKKYMKRTQRMINEAFPTRDYNNHRDKWINKVFTMKSGLDIRVVEYLNARQLKVEFIESKKQVFVTLAQLRNKGIKEPK